MEFRKILEILLKHEYFEYGSEAGKAIVLSAIYDCFTIIRLSDYTIKFSVDLFIECIKEYEIPISFTADALIEMLELIKTI